MSKDKLAQVFHFDLYGKREDKYKFLDDNSMSSIKWDELEVKEPNFYFVNKNFDGKKEYEFGFKIDGLFRIYSSGVKTHDDGNLISSSVFNENNQDYYYRPFDTKYINYDLKRVMRHRFEVMKNMLKPNIALLVPRQSITGLFGFFISKGLTDINYTGTAGQFGAGLTFPLYLYPETKTQQRIEQKVERIPNLNPEIVNQIAQKLGLRFTNEKAELEDIPESASPVCYATSSEVREEFMISEPSHTFAPIDILDYIYAVLHSPTYREKYKEFLKIDFPRVPYPSDTTTFWQLVALGGGLRQIHLLESAVVEKYITQYPVDGNNVVTKIRFEYITEIIDGDSVISLTPIPELMEGKVFINDTQYFDKVPERAWNFYIGGYQPAQKWLKDRKGRELSFDDILHYQKIIVALTETDRIMKEIDEIKIGE
jgi:predicted helicase